MSEPMVIHLRTPHGENMSGGMNRPSGAPRRSKKRSVLITLIASAVLLIVLMAGGWMTYTWLSGSNVEENSDEDIEELVEQVGKHILLPEGEKPTVATVTDTERLKDQLFFKNAHVGDRVLMYTQAQRAILYDPNEDKIIEVAPIVMNEDQL